MLQQFLHRSRVYFLFVICGVCECVRGTFPFSYTSHVNPGAGSPLAPFPLPSTAIADALSAQAALLSLSPTIDPSLLHRLDVSAAHAATHVTASVSCIIGAVEQCVPGFVSTARRRCRTAHKRLEMDEEEITDTVKALQSCLRLLTCLDDGGSLEDTSCCVNRLLGVFRLYPSVSIAVSSAIANTAQLMIAHRLSHVDIGVHSPRSAVSHPAWFERGAQDTVTITACDHCDVAGEPVYGLTIADLSFTFCMEATGWSIASACVDANVASFAIKLEPNCTDAAELAVCIGSTPFTLQLKVGYDWSLVYSPLLLSLLS